jgi:hypothetical protein
MKIGKWGASDCLCDCVSKGKGRVRPCGCMALGLLLCKSLFFFIYSIFFLSEPNRFGLVGV